MSSGGGEFDVDWAPVDDQDCDNLFAPDRDDDDGKDNENAAMISEDDADEATHPETAGQSSEEEDPPSIHSSVDDEEGKEDNVKGEDGAFPTSNNSWENEAPSRPSWVTNDSSVEDNQSIPKDSRPPPYEPPPNDIAKTEVKNLSPGTSRLATFSGDLKLRFSDNSNNSQGSDEFDQDGPEVKQSEEDDDDDGFPQEQHWPGDDDVGPRNAGGDDDEDENREAAGGDAFSAEVIKPTERAPSKLGRELSTNWMNFDDDKWGSSMHSKQQSEHSKPSVGQPMKFDEEKWDSAPPKALEEQTTTSILSRATSSGTRSSKTTTFADDVTEPEEVPKASKYKKKKNGKQGGFSLEAGLAIVSQKTGAPSMVPEAEQNGGAEANEVVSFWQEGEAEEAEEDDNDPLSMALKAKQAEQPHDSRSEERKLYDSNTFKTTNLSSYSQLSSPSPHQDSQQPVGPGWLQKGLGSAMNLVANNLSNLPFTKPKDTDEPIKDDNVEEAEEAEEDDMPFPNYTNLNMGAPGPTQATTARTESMESMADVSAMSEDTPNRMGAGEKAGMSKSDREDAIIRATAAAMNQQADSNYDPLRAAVEKMNDQSTVDDNTRGITFSKETKMARLAFKINPIFDLFIDLPHPTAETGDAPDGGATFIGAPTDVDEEVMIQERIRDSMQDISCLTFPDYDSTILQEEEEEGATPLFGETIMEIPGFQHYTFTLKLESGTLIYAHVRRYLPPIEAVPFRYDVGRRLGRAMVMFTRFPGGDDFFATVLKTLDAIGSQHKSMKHASISRPQKWFLQNLYQKHYRVCQNYATNLEDRRGGPHILTIQGLEFADCMEFYAHVDSTHFFMPKSLLHTPVIPQMKTSFTCGVLPVLRCLGVVNSLRLFSAMLSERRIIMVSCSATRLDRSVRAALTMLTHGMLNWAHISISVLPPDLWSVLKSPSPYIVGILAPLAYRLELTDRLGDVVVFNLDENSVVSMGDQKLNKLVPDLCRSLSEEMLKKRRIALPENVATEKDMTALSILNSTADFLAQDLVEIFKADKKTMFGTSVKAKHVAKKATKVVKSTFNFFFGGGGGQEEEGEQEVVEVKKTKQEKKMEPDAIYIEGCRNEAGEEAARLAFASFFLRILGNRDGYAYENEDSDFNFDKEKFLLERESRGDGGGSPMWSVLVNFCETQMAQDWVRMREEHIRARQPMPIDAPLFWQCVDFLEMKDIDFGILNVRSVSRMMLQKTSVQQMLPSNVRRLAMALTSKRKFEGNSDEAVSDIAELARESGSALYDVMSVVWLRTRDSKGLQWVHGYQSMKVLREVLLHGPLAAVADATDGIQRVRTLAFRRSQGCEQIQEVAMEIYNLLADRSRLFLRRRIAAEHRRNLRDTEESPFTRDTRLNLKTSFKEVHSAMNPALRPPEVPRRRASLSSRRASLSTRLPHRLSITKHIMALEPLDDENSLDGFNILPHQDRATRQRDFAKELVHDTLNNRPEGSQSGSLGGDLATARRYVREIGRKTKENEKERVREQARRRDTNAMGVELLKKQFMLLKVAIYISPIFYFFGNHEHFLAIVMFLWLSQQLQVFRAPIDTGSY